MRIGRRIVWGAGLGKTGMGGPGSATIRGVGHRIITGVGFMSLDMAGAGIRELLATGITGRPHWWRSSDLAAGADSDSGSGTSDGCRWRRASLFIAGGDADTTAGVASTAASTLRT